MPLRKVKKKKNSKRRLRTKAITVKLTGLQMMALQNYCRLHHTTPNKVIRGRLAPFVSEKFRKISEERYILPNQLDLFS